MIAAGSFGPRMTLVNGAESQSIHSGSMPPYLRARARSKHGYDVDHKALNPELGGDNRRIRYAVLIRFPTD